MEESGTTNPKRRGRRSKLSLGKKKFRRVPSTEENDISMEHFLAEKFPFLPSPSQNSQSTQVTPLKYISGHMQTDVSVSATSELLLTDDKSISPPSSPTTNLPLMFQQLHSEGILEQLSQVLFCQGQTKDFSNLLRNIATGKIAPQNICWLLNLHLARLTSVETTTLMRWDETVIEFFSVVYILFGASAINVLRGPMNFSELVMENMEK